ncbi:MAG: spore coat U domain-containing protein, partial [Nitrospirota bacterium]
TGPLDAAGTITIDCNETPPPAVTISIGQSPNSGGFDPRAMRLAAGSELLSYNLYTDSGRTYIWGNGTGNTVTVSARVFKNKPEARTVYGRISPLQNVSAGSYRETLAVTILW